MTIVKKYIIRCRQKVKCAGCGRNISSTTHCCYPTDNPTGWIDVSPKAGEKINAIIIQNISKLLERPRCRILRAVETEEEYNRMENSPFIKIDRNGVMRIELQEQPYSEHTKINWILNEFNEDVVAFIPADRCSTPPGYWNLD